MAEVWRPGMIVCHREFVPAFCVRLTAYSPAGYWYGFTIPGAVSSDERRGVVKIPLADAGRWRAKEERGR